MNAMYVEITATKGSAPRDAGTTMKVTMLGSQGTIGGGALEHQAIAQARKLLAARAHERSVTVPLGPGLGQCCGGSVTLRYTYEKRATDPEINRSFTPTGDHNPQHALWLWGAGHVGRAVVQNCPPSVAEITWVDRAADRFPPHMPDHVKPIPTADMPHLARHAPTHAHHLIFTYSHDIDLALCAALLRRGAASIGLIGSKTKWTRFQKRLVDLGLDPAPITCPIGDKSLGKTPDAIAKGCVTGLVALIPLERTA